ncbi:unnamed protein product [Arabidopsis halleri]
MLQWLVLKRKKHHFRFIRITVSRHQRDSTTRVDSRRFGHESILEEESTPQFPVPIANSEILRGCEIREVKLELENLEYVVMDKNLENEWVQKDTTKRFEVEGDVESQKMISNTKICSHANC